MTESAYYEIQVQEQLDDHWPAWFDGMTVARGQESTIVLRGPVLDQAALYGLLDKTRDMGLTLISVQRIDPADPHRAIGCDLKPTSVRGLPATRGRDPSGSAC